jgi:hypothetical protein
LLSVVNWAEVWDLHHLEEGDGAELFQADEEDEADVIDHDLFVVRNVFNG